MSTMPKSRKDEALLELVWKSLVCVPFGTAEDVAAEVNEDFPDDRGICDEGVEELLDELCDRGMAHGDEGVDGELIYLAGPGGGFCVGCAKLDEKLAHSLFRLHNELDRHHVAGGLIRDALRQAVFAYQDQDWAAIVRLLLPVQKDKAAFDISKIKQAASSVVAWAKKLDAGEED